MPPSVVDSDRRLTGWSTLRGGLLAAMIALPIFAAAPADADARPNVVLIMTDDMSYCDLSGRCELRRIPRNTREIRPLSEIGALTTRWLDRG
jgi:hypothetical protein